MGSSEASDRHLGYNFLSRCSLKILGSDIAFDYVYPHGLFIYQI